MSSWSNGLLDQTVTLVNAKLTGKFTDHSPATVVAFSMRNTSVEIHSQPQILEGSQELLACCSTDASVREAAFARLSQFLLRVAYARLHGQVGLRQTAEDCVQQALFTIWQKLSEGRGPEKSEFFLSWCASIVIHKVLDELRKLGRSDAESLEEHSSSEESWYLQLSDPTTPAPQTESLETEAKTELVAMIQNHRKLTADGKTILLYGFLLEWNDEALANYLHKESANIRLICFRAVRTLRRDPEFMQRLGEIASFFADRRL